jgi:hypothetical protein
MTADGPATPVAVLRRPPASDRTEALDEPFTAFPSWFMRVTCDRCGKVQMVNMMCHPPNNLTT